jgi:phosphate transport system protein
MWKNLIALFQRDNLYTQAIRQTHEMLDLDWTMFQASIESLRQSDTGEIKIDIYAMDKMINRDERDIRKKVMTHLAIAGTRDLSAGLVLVSIVIDIERIGDYTKNIYDLARAHPRRLHGHSLEPKLVEAEQGVSKLFRDMIQAYKTSNEDLARAVMVGYKEGLSAACEGITTSVVSGQVTDVPPHDAAAIALYARFLKRIAAHSRNIISSVVNPFHRIGYREKK